MAHLLRLFGGSGGGGLVLSKISARPLFCGLRQRGHNSRQQSTDAASATAKGSFDGSVKSAGETADVVDRLRRSFGDVLACGGVVPVYKQALLYGNKIAIKDQFGEFSYAQLYTGAKKLASQITHLCGSYLILIIGSEKKWISIALCRLIDELIEIDYTRQKGF